jgi:tellurite resistance protein
VSTTSTGAAVVSAARGPIDDAERAYVVNVLDSLELLHHTDREAGLAVFNEFAQGITDDPDSGLEKAMRAQFHGYVAPPGG